MEIFNKKDYYCRILAVVEKYSSYALLLILWHY